MNDGYVGTLNPGASLNPYNSLRYIIKGMLRRIHTAIPVEVVAVTTNGGVAPIGFVDVKPLVNMIDGRGTSYPHGTVFHCPYVRLQGGTNAIIIDPQVGDQGLFVCCHRDISSAVANKGQANPGSGREFSLADGIYVGMMMGATPTRYIQFNASGITIHDPALITIDAPDVKVNCTTSEVTATGAVTVNAASISATTTGNLSATVGGTASVSATTAMTFTAPTVTFNVTGMVVNASHNVDIYAPAAAQVGSGGGMGTGGVNFSNTAAQNAGHQLQQF